MRDGARKELTEIAVPILIAEAAVIAGLYIAVVLGVFQGLLQ